MHELDIVRSLNHLWQGTFVDSITKAISYNPFLITLWIVVAFSFLLFDKKRGKPVFFSILIAMALHFLIDEALIKDYLGDKLGHIRLRPYMTDPGTIKAIGFPFVDSSFPSSHMASTLAALTPIVYFYRKFWPYALAFVLLMAFARMHNGLHYPSDVLTGTVFGLLFGCIGVTIAKRFWVKK